MKKEILPSLQDSVEKKMEAGSWKLEDGLWQRGYRPAEIPFDFFALAIGHRMNPL